MCFIESCLLHGVVDVFLVSPQRVMHRVFVHEAAASVEASRLAPYDTGIGLRALHAVVEAGRSVAVYDHGLVWGDDAATIAVFVRQAVEVDLSGKAVLRVCDTVADEDEQNGDEVRRDVGDAGPTSLVRLIHRMNGKQATSDSIRGVAEGGRWGDPYDLPEN